MKTLDEVIKAYEICTQEQSCSLCPYIESDTNGKWACSLCGDCTHDALHYLKTIETTENLYHDAVNELFKLKDEDWKDRCLPLTWDELKQMEGKPVWVEEKYSFNKEWHGRWEVICSVWDNEWDDDPYLSMTNEEYRHKDDMGERWQAFRKERK